MDLSQINMILISGILSLLIGFFIYHLKKPAKFCSAPQAGGAWPIIGHLHLFGSHQLTHKTIGDMAETYGPIFTISLGSNKVLVLSSWEMAKECFTVHDKVFSTRPIVAASKLMGFDGAMFGFAPYGPYWREMRKLATIELLSNHRIEMLKGIRESELEIATKELYKYWSREGCPKGGVLVDMKEWFGDFTQNIVLRIVRGKPYFGSSDDDEYAEEEARGYCKKVIRDYAYLFGVFELSDAIPFVGWLGFHRYEKAMKRIARELDSLVGRWLDEHKQRRSLRTDEEEDQDFMDVMLTTMEGAKMHGFDSDTIIKATCLNLIIAGSDTTMVTLIWALSLLLNNHVALKKIQEELDIHIGRNRMVQDSDLKNLVYLQAVVKETLRLYPPSPFVTLRAAMSDCTFSSGHQIPAGTHLMVNAWKIQRDDRVWSDPHEFKPERFLSSHKDIDVRGQNFELIPFGSGRRSCPGASLALQVVHLALARLLQSFYVATPSNEIVDMTESNGLTNLKATPLEVLLIPRLDAKLYVN
ncbi:cytochrome P450 CYP82D47-like [Senna tora]|uniref:Cytochrome P450 CYP82D47-like n=1 Tax=Senna tora TaxID=362788 RepID=A0A834W4V9_9FABA|nr:cytochrome P450 CYP82D47-like [Senna tora]